MSLTDLATTSRTPGKLELGDGLDEVVYDDPFKWSTSRKWMISCLMACCTLTSTFCSSIFSSAIVVTAREFHTTETVMLLSVSLFVIGYALGPLLWGPLSELVGRKIPMFVGFFIFAVMQIPIALSPNLTGILVCRLIAGCCGAAPVALVTAAFADFWDPANRGTATAVYSVAAYAGPTLGPICGSFITESHLGWRWTAWLILIMAGVFGIPSVILVPETYAPVLRERALKAVGHQDVNRKNPFDGFVSKYLSRPMSMLSHELMLDIMTLYIAVVYAIMYLTFFAYPYAFGERGWDRHVASLSFLSLLVGILTACFGVWQYSTRYYVRRLKARGVVRPEDRLPPVMLGSVMLPLGLFMFAWTSFPSITWVPQMMSGFLIGAGIMLIFTNGIVYLVDIYGQSSASAMAANTFVRSAAAAGLPLAAPTMYRNLGTPWATSLLGFLTLFLVPAPFIFHRYGEVLRKRSKFASAPRIRG